jgi:hypothetical protein
MLRPNQQRNKERQETSRKSERSLLAGLKVAQLSQRLHSKKSTFLK